MDDFVRRLCACGYSDGFARQICLEFLREIGSDLLSEYISEIETNALHLCHVAEVQP